MKISRGLPTGKASVRRLLVIGFFDGVHRGHAAIIEDAARRGRELALPVSLLTFEPHPGVLRGQGAPPLLTGREEQAALLEGMGVEELIIAGFDEELASMSGRQFVEKMVKGGTGAAGMIVGANFRFGRERSCGAEDLVKLAEESGAMAEIVPLLMDGARPISSSRIRRHLERGEVEEAMRLLGRPYSLSGVVQCGEEIARKLGYPTANLPIPEGRVIPADGVYATRARVDGAELPAVSLIGPAPTFGLTRSLIEVHVLNQVPELYGKELTVSFLKLLRRIEKFPDAEALKRAIEVDVAAAAALQEEAAPGGTAS